MSVLFMSSHKDEKCHNHRDEQCGTQNGHAASQASVMVMVPVMGMPVRRRTMPAWAAGWGTARSSGTASRSIHRSSSVSLKSEGSRLR